MKSAWEFILTSRTNALAKRMKISLMYLLDTSQNVVPNRIEECAHLRARDNSLHAVYLTQ